MKKKPGVDLSPVLSLQNKLQRAGSESEGLQRKQPERK
jgi:hypothetical protein